MKSPMKYSAVLFDFIGTTVVEKHPDIITTCFERAFQTCNVEYDPSIIQHNRGKNKQEIINLIIKEKNFPAETGSAIFNVFNSSIENNLQYFDANEGALELFNLLKKIPVKIGLGSGLTHDIVYKIMNRLQWQDQFFDYIGTANTVKRGRPYPDMIHDMMQKFKIADPASVLKVGDTVADIQEGKNAGATTVIILSGTQPKEKLLQEKPDFAIHKLMEIEEIINA